MQRIHSYGTCRLKSEGIKNDDGIHEVSRIVAELFFSTQFIQEEYAACGCEVSVTTTVFSYTFLSGCKKRGVSRPRMSVPSETIFRKQIDWEHLSSDSKKTLANATFSHIVNLHYLSVADSRAAELV